MIFCEELRTQDTEGNTRKIERKGEIEILRKRCIVPSFRKSTIKKFKFSKYTVMDVDVFVTLH